MTLGCCFCYACSTLNRVRPAKLLRDKQRQNAPICSLVSVPSAKLGALCTVLGGVAYCARPNQSTDLMHTNNGTYISKEFGQGTSYTTAIFHHSQNPPRTEMDGCRSSQPATSRLPHRRPPSAPATRFMVLEHKEKRSLRRICVQQSEDLRASTARRSSDLTSSN